MDSYETVMPRWARKVFDVAEIEGEPEVEIEGFL
jgi:hypothetical protein